ncbi:MAG: phosphopantothenoylcysteine decarboxylase [Candidatus Omnitrophota bacterium]
MVTRKRILITAGPTWVAIDQARVISNISSGETGFILASKFKRSGAKVTLLLGPGYFCGNLKRIKIIRFKYFSQLQNLLKRELEKNNYNAVIHAAAVADYRPDKVAKSKIDSKRNAWKINLVPNEKLIDSLKKYAGNIFAVGFKFEPSASSSYLIKEGRALLKRAGLDLVVANSNINEKYCAYILDKSAYFGPFFTKEKMSSCLLKLIGKN